MARKDKKKKDQSVDFNEDVQTEVTEQELEVGKEKKKKKPSMKKILTKSIVDYATTHVEECSDGLKEIVNEFNALPSRGGGPRGPSINSEIQEMILTQKVVHEDIFYNLFKAGRLEMKRKFYKMYKKTKDPKENIYVSFDPETGNYTLKGTGEFPPEGFIVK